MSCACQAAAPSASGPNQAHEGQLGILKRREIEAGILGPVYRILERDLGAEKAQAILKEAISADARKAGAEFGAREPGGASLQSFIDIQYLWEQDDALKVEVLEAGSESYRYNVTRCRYAEMYKAMGLGDIGHILSCTRDYEFPLAYDPRIRLTRSQTIMGGASHCDFHYTSAEVEARS